MAWERKTELETGNIEGMYLNKLEDGTMLGHAIHNNGFGHLYSIFSKGKTMPLNYIKPMIDGQIAIRPVLDARDALYAAVCNDPQKRAYELRDIHDFVNKYLNEYAEAPDVKPEEIITFKGIAQVIDRLRKGKSKPEDLRFFWGHNSRD